MTPSSLHNHHYLLHNNHSLSLRNRTPQHPPGWRCGLRRCQKTTRIDLAAFHVLTPHGISAAAALESREAEASKLKQRAQQLLRQRSELALELEGLQETLGRMDRAISRAKEQAQALKAEGTRYSTSDSRRHSAQLSTLSKAVLREKQRRLSARNELGSLQRQLVKSKTRQEAIMKRAGKQEVEHKAASERQAKAESIIQEARRLNEKLEQCQEEMEKLRSEEEAALKEDGNHSITAESLAREEAKAAKEQQQQQEQLVAELEAQLHRLKQHPTSTAGSVHSQAVSARRSSSQHAAQSKSVKQALAAEQAHARSAAPALDASTHMWSELRGRLHEEGPARARGQHASDEAVVEAAKWHAESRAFAAEVARVTRLQEAAARKRSAEREGWKEFGEEVARMRRRAAEHEQAGGGMASALRGDVAAAHEALAAAQREAEELLTGGGAMRARLDEATGRLRQMQGVMAELSAEAGLL